MLAITSPDHIHRVVAEGDFDGVVDVNDGWAAKGECGPMFQETRGGEGQVELLHVAAQKLTYSMSRLRIQPWSKFREMVHVCV